LSLSAIFPIEDGRGKPTKGAMFKPVRFAALIGAVALSCGTANAESLFAFLLPPSQTQIAPQAAAPALTEERDDAQLDPRLRRQIVNYSSREAPGTLVIDTPHTFLYYVLGNGKAIRYGIGVGREGFTWSGVQSISRKQEWPDWIPPAEMVARQPYLPRMTSGGPGNPLGARAMYIAGTQYRIHGTNAPSTIGRHVSSGCIRLANEDVIDLYNRVQIGAKVIVLPQTAVAKSEHASLTDSYAARGAKPKHRSGGRSFLR
jgi:lipoprotein-anchoring transpeptidase ErfK/SrfK